ncbi:MAG: hypothetical protein K2R98_28340 [Gemmataceae bacterium]|nr:hypothetical protein [Gemmataceae bacterium]
MNEDPVDYLALAIENHDEANHLAAIAAALIDLAQHQRLVAEEVTTGPRYAALTAPQQEVRDVWARAAAATPKKKEPHAMTGAPHTNGVRVQAPVPVADSDAAALGAKPAAERTLREHFAGLAMAAQVSRHWRVNPNAAVTAERAVLFADALLERLAAPPATKEFVDPYPDRSMPF